jgi:hypothetical protein
MAPVLKTGVPERVSGVRIPPLPPFRLRGLEVEIGCRRNERNPHKIEFSFADLDIERDCWLKHPACAGEFLQVRRLERIPGN